MDVQIRDQRMRKTLMQLYQPKIRFSALFRDQDQYESKSNLYRKFTQKLTNIKFVRMLEGVYRISENQRRAIIRKYPNPFELMKLLLVSWYLFIMINIHFF